MAEAEHCNGDFLWIDQIGQIKKACACLRRPSAKREGVGRRRQPPPDSKAADLYQRQAHAKFKKPQLFRDFFALTEEFEL